MVDKILKHVQSEGFKTVSFDIFDTLVFRRCACPKEVFSNSLAFLPSHVNMTMDKGEYGELRVQTERQAKRNTLSGEVSLEQIYVNMPFLEETSAALLQAELAAEKCFGYVYAPMQQLIAKLQKQGVKVFLVSDMYLSKAQIRECFFSCYPDLQNLPLYVSSEYELNKASGLLFDNLSKLNQIDKASWYHIGDNPLSDYRMPIKMGLQAKCLAPQVDSPKVMHLESALFPDKQHFNFVRMLAATHNSDANEPIACDIGSLVWGPVLFSFVDWVIDQTVKANSNCILCFMREAEVFTPLIKLRLQHRNVNHISVRKLYASRKSTFWPSIDVKHKNWFEDLIYILVQRRGYTVDDFYRDFQLNHDDLHAKHKHVLVRDADGCYFQGNSLLKRLTNDARANIHAVKHYIEQQRLLFLRYYEHHIGDALDDCTVVDLGNGGTIHHHLEAILKRKSANNLLLYSSERIYRFSATTKYSSYISVNSSSSQIRQILSRSPECIEPFLVGDCGTTLGYKNNECGTPILADKLELNSALVNSFMKGVLGYFRLHNDLAVKPIQVEQVVPILYRYVQLPTMKEAQLFTRIFHQDNFGSNDAYPVITSAQIEQVKKMGLDHFYQEFCRRPRVKLGKIHWPQSVMTLLSEKFLIQQHGLMSMDADSDVLGLLESILESGWQSFSIYGAGEFFEKLLPYLYKNNLEVVDVIDRKVEMSGTFKVAGFDVISLEAALKNRVERIVISSLAFKDEIARNIYEQSVKHGGARVEVLSL